MINKNLFAISCMPLIALMACTNGESTAGSATIPNATAEKIEFKTAATKSVEMNNVSIDVFTEETGASATCGANGKSYTGKAKLGVDGLVESYLNLKNFGNACDSIFNMFKSSCGSATPSGSCDENGNLETYCSYTDGEFNYLDLMYKLRIESDASCNSFEAINMQHTLDKYAAQFADDPNELSFDSHVLAYNGTFPMIISSEDDYELFRDKTGTRKDTDPFIREVDAFHAVKFFPMTAAIAGNGIYQENCKTFIVISHDGGQPTGHMLTHISEGNIEITGISKGGRNPLTSNYFSVGFLVRDCDGLIDENSTVTFKGFTSKTWCSAKILQIPNNLDEEATYIDNPYCNENQHENAETYSEWFRADLTK